MTLDQEFQKLKKSFKDLKREIGTTSKKDFQSRLENLINEIGKIYNVAKAKYKNDQSLTSLVSQARLLPEESRGRAADKIFLGEFTTTELEALKNLINNKIAPLGKEIQEMSDSF